MLVRLHCRVCFGFGIVVIETGTFEDNPNRIDDLLKLAAAVLAYRERFVFHRLMDVELYAAHLAAVGVGRHGQPFVGTQKLRVPIYSDCPRGSRFVAALISESHAFGCRVIRALERPSQTIRQAKLRTIPHDPWLPEEVKHPRIRLGKPSHQPWRMD